MKRSTDSFGALEFDRRGRRRIDGDQSLDNGRKDKRGASRSSDQPLLPTPALTEKTEVYPIAASEKLNKFCSDLSSSKDFAFSSVQGEDRMLTGHFCAPSLVRDLWEQKFRLDSVFDNGHSAVYYHSRKSLFPQTYCGSGRFGNRAGDKLFEVLESVHLIKDVQKDRDGKGRLRGYHAFVDCCGGPGAFSEVLMRQDVSRGLRGYGITLREGKDKGDSATLTWYRHLQSNERFTPIYGPSGTGDVYSSTNLDAVVDCIRERGDSDHVKVYVSDGGFEIKVVDGVHMEHLQELYSGRILLSEVLLMMRTLTEDGHFVMKIFDTFSTLTASLIYAVTLLFKKVYIVKPSRSRIVNSEKYLVGVRMRRHGNSHKLLLRELSKVHRIWSEEEKRQGKENLSPESVLPLHQMTNDADFVRSMRTMNEKLGTRETRALKLVMDDVDERLKHMKKEEGDANTRR